MRNNLLRVVAMLTFGLCGCESPTAPPQTILERVTDTVRITQTVTDTVIRRVTDTVTITVVKTDSLYFEPDEITAHGFTLYRLGVQEPDRPGIGTGGGFLTPENYEFTFVEVPFYFRELPGKTVLVWCRLPVTPPGWTYEKPELDPITRPEVRRWRSRGSASFWFEPDSGACDYAPGGRTWPPGSMGPVELDAHIVVAP